MHRRSLPIGASALVASLAAPPARAQALEAWLAPRARLWERWVAHDAAATARLDHRAWTGFLQRYRQVGTDRIARINYAAVTPADRAVLESWLSGLAGTSVAQLNRAEQFAYWVNLYNGLTVRTVLGVFKLRIGTLIMITALGGMAAGRLVSAGGPPEGPRRGLGGARAPAGGSPCRAGSRRRADLGGGTAARL